jgi:parallel beta-helix repeat protein
MYKDVPYYNGNSQYGGMSLSKIRNAVIEGNTIDLRQCGSYSGIALSDSDRVVIRNNTFADDFTEGKGKDQPKHIWVDEKTTNVTRSGNITRLGASVDP